MAIFVLTLENDRPESEFVNTIFLRAFPRGSPTKVVSQASESEEELYGGMKDMILKQLKPHNVWYLEDSVFIEHDFNKMAKYLPCQEL